MEDKTILISEDDESNINGLEVSRIIKDYPDLNDIPILPLTSYTMEKDEEAALTSGCDQHISKPIDFKTFREIVAKCCGD